MWRRAADVGVSLMKGFGEIPEAVVGLADIPTLGRAGKFLKDKLGYDPAADRAFWESLYTPEQKQAFENVRRAEGFLGTAKAALANSSVIGHSVVESLPGMFAAGAAGGMVGRAVPAVEAIAGGIGEGLQQAGSAAEQTRQDSQSGTLTPKQSLAALASGVGTTAFGILGGKIAQKLGIEDVDTLAASITGKAVTKEAKEKEIGLAKKIIYGAFQEGALEELPQSIQEQVWQNYAEDRPLDEGVAAAGVLGAFAGAVMGGGANLLHGGHGTHNPGLPHQDGASAPAEEQPNAPITPPPPAPPPPQVPTAQPPAPPPPQVPQAPIAPVAPEPPAPIAPEPAPPAPEPEPEAVKPPLDPEEEAFLRELEARQAAEEEAAQPPTEEQAPTPEEKPEAKPEEEEKQPAASAIDEDLQAAQDEIEPEPEKEPGKPPIKKPRKPIIESAEAKWIGEPKPIAAWPAVKKGEVSPDEAVMLMAMANELNELRGEEGATIYKNPDDTFEEVQRKERDAEANGASVERWRNHPKILATYPNSGGTELVDILKARGANRGADYGSIRGQILMYLAGKMPHKNTHPGTMEAVKQLAKEWLAGFDTKTKAFSPELKVGESRARSSSVLYGISPRMDPELWDKYAKPYREGRHVVGATYAGVLSSEDAKRRRREALIDRPGADRGEEIDFDPDTFDQAQKERAPSPKQVGRYVNGKWEWYQNGPPNSDGDDGITVGIREERTGPWQTIHVKRGDRTVEVRGMDVGTPPRPARPDEEGLWFANEERGGDTYVVARGNTMEGAIELAKKYLRGEHQGEKIERPTKGKKKSTGKPPVKERSVQDESYDEWEANASKVAANPEAASAKDLRRAVHYLSHRLIEVRHAAEKAGKTADKDVMAGLNNEIEWYQRLATEKEKGKPPIKANTPEDVPLPGDVGKVRDVEVETPKIDLPEQGITLKSEDAAPVKQSTLLDLSDEKHKAVKDALAGLRGVLSKNLNQLNSGIPVDKELALHMYRVVKALADAGITDAQIAWNNAAEYLKETAGDLQLAFKVAWKQRFGQDPTFTTDAKPSKTPEERAERVRMMNERFRREEQTAKEAAQKQADDAMTPELRRIGDTELGFGTYPRVLIKDLARKDLDYALRVIEAMTSDKAVYAARYLVKDPLVIKALGKSAVATISPDENAILEDHDLKGEVNGPVIAITGVTKNATYARKEVLGKYGNWNAAAKAWVIAGRKFASFIRDLGGLPTAPKKGGRKIASHLRDERLRALREAAEREPDRSGFDDGIRPYVSDRTEKIIQDGGKAAGIAPAAIDEQVEDVAKITRAYENNYGAFVLASEPGTGKTFVLGGAMREMLARGAKKIVYVTQNRKLISQAQENLANFGLEDRIQYVTYSKMRLMDPEATDVIVFDEAHNVKNVSVEAAAAQAKQAQEWIGKTKFTVIATGTPYENPTQVKYLAPTGIFDKPFGGFHDFAQAYGAEARQIKDTNLFHYIWMPTTTSEEDQKQAREWMVKKGIYTSRRIQLPADQVDMRMSKIEVSKEWQDLYDALVAERQNHGKVDPKWLKNYSKRLLEAAKLPESIKEAQKALDRGRFPIIFIETYSERIYDIPALMELEKKWKIEAAAAARVGDPPPNRKAYGLPPKHVPEFLEAVAKRIGKTEIHIPAAEKVIKDHFGDGKVAIYTGAHGNERADKDLLAWRKGDKPVLVATIKKGGTGLSLHDTVGNHQTTQINNIMPWTATLQTQVAQRSTRYGLKGKSEVLWLFAPSFQIENQLSQRVGQRMADMGALVHGQVKEGADTLRGGQFTDPLFGEVDPLTEEDDDDAESYKLDGIDESEDEARKEADDDDEQQEEPAPKTYYDQEPGPDGGDNDTVPGGKVFGFEIPELVELARELMQIPSIVARFRKAGVLGSFNPGTGRIRLTAALFQKGRERELAQVLAHEIGHLIDWLPDFDIKRGNLLGRLYSLHKFMKHTFVDANGDIIELNDIKPELQEVVRQWNNLGSTLTDKQRKYYFSSREMMADAMSALLTDPEFLQKTAPTFYERWFDAMQLKPDVEAEYYRLQAVMRMTPEERTERRLEADEEMSEKGDVKAIETEKSRLQRLRDMRFKNLWLALRSQLVNRHTIWKELKKKNPKLVIPEDADPNLLVSERNYVGGKIKGWMQQVVEPLYNTLNEAGVSWHHFGLFMHYDRIIHGDRDAKANPGGTNPFIAQQKRDALAAKYTAKQMETIEDGIGKFRFAIQDIVKEAKKWGIYSDEAFKKFSDFYVTYHVLDYIDSEVRAQVRHGIGTFKDIKNVANATILKMAATIKEIENQKAKMGGFDYVRKVAPSEIEDGGSFKYPKRPKNRDLKAVNYLKNGSWHRMYVDPYIADSLNNESIGKNIAVVKMINTVNSAVFRPLFTGLNPGFQTFNLVRDFLRTWKTTPGLSLINAVAEYTRSIPIAKVRAFGISDPNEKGQLAAIKRGLLGAFGLDQATQLKGLDDLIQAERAGTFSVTFNEYNSRRAVEDTEIEDILSRFSARHGTPPVRHGLGKIVGGLVAIREFIKNTGDFIETLPKAAAMYHIAGERPVGKLTPRERAFIRERVGTPDAMAGGTLKPVTNEVFLFSNIIVQGAVSDWETISAPFKTPGSFRTKAKAVTTSGALWKTMAVNVLPKFLMMAALAGAGGEWLKKLLSKVSEYDKTNYLIVPIDIDEKGNAVYARLPQDDTGRLLGGLVWKLLRMAKGDKEIGASLAQVFAYTYGQFPSTTPIIGTIGDAAAMVSNQNPYDDFRSRNLFTDDEMRAGGWQKWKKFFGWEFQQLGGSIVWKFVPGETRPREQTAGQKILEWPVWSNIAGRWIRISDYGEHEQLQEQGKSVERDESRHRLAEKEELNNAIREYMNVAPWERQGNRGQGKRYALARQIVQKVYADRDRDEQSRRTHEIQKKIQMGVTRGQADPLVEEVMKAKTNLQRKTMIEGARKSMTPEEYSGWLDRAASQSVISRELSQELKHSAKR